MKIDRSFVRDAVERPEDLAITEAIVRLANGLGMSTVAEGIETVEQRDLLRRLGCGSAQGFWWSGAVPMSDLSGAVPGDRAASRVARLREPEVARYTERRIMTPRRRVLEATAATEHATACCLRGGLEAGQGWLVVSTPDRREAFGRSLGTLHTTAIDNGQLVELDAYETLRKVTGSDGRLDPTRFETVVGTALRKLGDRQRPGRRARRARPRHPAAAQPAGLDRPASSAAHGRPAHPGVRRPPGGLRRTRPAGPPAARDRRRERL